MRTKFKLGMALGVLVALGLSASQPVSAAIVNGGFEQFPDFTGYTTAGNATIQASDFRTPVEGVQQALISTAPGAVTGGSNPITATALDTFLGLSGSNSTASQGATNGSGFKQTLVSIASGDIVTFKFDFYTQEPRPTTRNDFAFVSVNGVLTRLATVNTAALVAPPATTGIGDNSGINSFAGVLETGFLSFTIGAAQGLVVGNNTIGFGVVNVFDTNVQSGLIVDAIVQSAGGPGGGGPIGGGGVPLPAGAYLMTLGLVTAGLCSTKLRRTAAC